MNKSTRQINPSSSAYELGMLDGKAALEAIENFEMMLCVETGLAIGSSKTALSAALAADKPRWQAICRNYAAGRVHVGDKVSSARTAIYDRLKQAGLAAPQKRTKTETAEPIAVTRELIIAAFDDGNKSGLIKLAMAWRPNGDI